jgi:hypothetical protein
MDDSPLLKALRKAENEEAKHWHSVDKFAKPEKGNTLRLKPTSPNSVSAFEPEYVPLKHKMLIGVIFHIINFTVLNTDQGGSPDRFIPIY